MIMRNKILLFVLNLMFLVNAASADWIAGNPSSAPSSPIPACQKVSVSGSFTWLSSNNYINDNHFATLTYALPPSVIGSTGTPRLVDNATLLPVPSAIFTQSGNNWTCTFQVGTVFPGFTDFTFYIDSLEIVDNPSFFNQQSTHYIGFLAAPPGDNFFNNSATTIFSTAAAPTLTGNDTICVGATTQLIGSGTPATPTAWTTSNPAVASVSNLGLVTGLTSGTSIITYTNAAGCDVDTLVTVRQPALAPSASPSASVCPGDTVTLSSGFAGGVSYTWNSLPSGSDTTLAPAVAGTYTVGVTDANGCTATASITIAINTPPTILGVSATPPTACIGGNVALSVSPGLAGPLSPYCASGATNGFDTKIDTVSFAGVTVGTSLTAQETYTDNTATIIPIVAGTSYPLFVRNGSSTNNYYGGFLNVYIDYNQNNVFDPSEEIYSATATGLNTLPPTTITVPATALNGQTRMRVILRESSSYTHPCGTWFYGETEDYTVNISGGVTPLAPFASIQWTPSTFLDTTLLANVNALGVTNNITYYVTGTDVNGCTVTDSIAIAVTPTPTGNTFLDPIVVSSFPYADTNSNQSSNCWTNAGSFTGNRASNDVFYRFTLPGCSDSIEVSLCVGATFDTYLHLLDSTGASIDFNDDFCSVQSQLNVGNLTPGATYTIVVEGFSSTSEGTYVLNMNAFEPLITPLAAATTNVTIAQGDNTSIKYVDTNCTLIATVTDGVGGNILGNTVSTVNIDPIAQFHNGQPFVRRWYQITPASNGAADVTLYFTQADFDDINAVTVAPYLQLPTTGSNTDPNIGNIRITKNDDGGLTVNPIVLTPTSVNWNGQYWEVTVSVPGFSQFRAHSVNPNNTALSVNYIDFTVRKEGAVDVVEWSTSQEINNSHFNVQRSLDGSVFENLGQVNTKALNGNSSQPLSYSFIDENPKIGHNYYRLEQVDLDNTKNYTKVIDVVWAASGSVVSIYPNPTNDVINVDLTSNMATQTEIKLVDMSGRVVKSAMAQTAKGLNNIKMSLSEIASGVYGIQIFENNKLTYIGKVRKN